MYSFSVSLAALFVPVVLLVWDPYSFFPRWLLLESLYWIYYNRNQKSAQELRSVPGMTEQERENLINQCIATTGSDFVRGWFYFNSKSAKNTDSSGERIYPPIESIKLGNLHEWLSWGLFGKSSVQELCMEERRQMLGISSMIEKQFMKKTGQAFGEGYNNSIAVVRLDGPVSSFWKPLALFFLLQAVWLTGACLCYFKGFRYKRFGEVKYWIKETSSNNKCPVVFSHGIGFGLVPYLFYHPLVKRTDRTWILVELPDRPHIRQLSSYTMPEDYAQNVRGLIQRHGHDDAHFIGHSIGTIYLTWILRFQPGLAKSFVMVDPISLLLHRSEVLWNFLYKMKFTSPDGLRQKVLDFVLKNDLNVSYRLRRCFHWHKNILWIEDVPHDLPHIVFIGGQDEYIPAEDIRKYVLKAGKSNVIYEPEAKHGSFVMKRQYRELVISNLVPFFNSMG